MRTPTEYNYDDRNLLLLVLKKKALLSWPSCVSLIFENSQLHFTFSSFFYIFCLFPRKDGRGEKVPIFFFSEHNAFNGHESGACVCECE